MNGVYCHTDGLTADAGYGWLYICTMRSVDHTTTFIIRNEYRSIPYRRRLGVCVLARVCMCEWVVVGNASTVCAHHVCV